ncbi:MAG: hypothetical protein ACFFCT_03075 [Candidatus Odinarchaeota archaeon]
MSTCRRKKVTVFSLLLGMLLLIQTGFATSNAQGMEFPIDLTVNYEFWINHWIPDETPIGYTLEYNVTNWIDKENLTVEYYLNSTRFEDRLDSIKIETTDYPPIWTNVSTWKISDTVQLSGIDYTIDEKMYFKWVSETDYFECFKIARSFLYSSDLFNSTSIFYEANLGLLVGFFKTILRTDDGHNYYGIHSVQIGIIGTNFDLFHPLVENPYGTSIITYPETTTTTRTPITTRPSTSTASNPLTSLIGPIDLVLLIAIQVELLVLIQLRKFSKRQSISE